MAFDALVGAEGAGVVDGRCRQRGDLAGADQAGAVGDRASHLHRDVACRLKRTSAVIEARSGDIQCADGEEQAIAIVDFVAGLNSECAAGADAALLVADIFSNGCVAFGTGAGGIIQGCVACAVSVPLATVVAAKVDVAGAGSEADMAAAVRAVGEVEAASGQLKVAAGKLLTACGDLFAGG